MSNVKQASSVAGGRLQPQALELEAAVLGAVLLERDAYDTVSGLLTADSFYDPRNGLIFAAVAALTAANRPVDMLTVVEQLRADGRLEEAGGPFRLSELTSGVASAAHVEYHARLVADRKLARDLIRCAGEIQARAYEPGEEAAQLLEEAEMRLFNLAQQAHRHEVRGVDRLLREMLATMQRAGKDAGGVSGVPSGFNRIDRLTGGWQRGDLIIVAARPSMGKTAFALTMMLQMAVNYHFPVVMFSLEMSSLQLTARLLSALTEISGSKIRSGQLLPAEWEQLDRRLGVLNGAPIWIDDTPGLSVVEMRAKARRLVREQGVRCLFVDYLQLMSGGGQHFGSREQEVATISRSLKALAKELDVPVIALSQLNRGVEARTGLEGKRPQLSDLRESGAIEQDADVVCFIHRPEYYRIFEDAEGRSLVGMAEIIVAKHRNGAIGDALLRFRSEYARFEDLTDGQEQPF